MWNEHCAAKKAAAEEEQRSREANDAAVEKASMRSAVFAVKRQVRRCPQQAVIDRFPDKCYGIQCAILDGFEENPIPRQPSASAPGAHHPGGSRGLGRRAREVTAGWVSVHPLLRAVRRGLRQRPEAQPTDGWRLAVYPPLLDMQPILASPGGPPAVHRTTPRRETRRGKRHAGQSSTRLHCWEHATKWQRTGERRAREHQQRQQRPRHEHSQETAGASNQPSGSATGSGQGNSGQGSSSRSTGGKGTSDTPRRTIVDVAAPTAGTTAPSLDLRDTLKKKPVEEKPAFDLRQSINKKPAFDLRQSIGTCPPDRPVTDLRDSLSAGKRKQPGQQPSKEAQADDTWEGGEIDVHDGCKPDAHVRDFDKYEDGTGGGGGTIGASTKSTLSSAYRSQRQPSKREARAAAVGSGRPRSTTGNGCRQCKREQLRH